MSVQASSRSGGEEQPAKPGSKAAPRQKFDWRAALMRRWDRWVRTHFTGENIIAFLKTMAWVAPLTLLIWVYAEQEQESPVQTIPVPILVKCSDPSRIATVPPDEQVITIDGSGPQYNFDQFRDSLSPESPLVIDIGNVPPGVQQVPTLQRLADNPQLRKWGITVEKCSPAVLTVTIDTIQSKQIPVIAPSDLVRVQGVQFQPDKVEIRGPVSKIVKVQNITADLESLPDIKKTGQHTEPATLINTDPGSFTLIPATVSATFTVTDPEQPSIIPSVPIFLLAPKDVLDTYKINYDPPFLSNLHVIGPAEQLVGIQHGDIQPIAELQIDKVDPSLAGHPTPVTLKILDLPDGVRLDPAFPAPQVMYTATER